LHNSHISLSRHSCSNRLLSNSQTSPGTGKSSFVCALCVGLGGSTRLLGRADHVSSFVRRGTNEGEVTITLASDDPSRPHVIRRKIKAVDNSSLWFLNGRESNLRDVTEIVKGLNIQLDNLCQFLPQDKVVEFARMKPVELLAATEEAVGDTSLKDMHVDLIKLRKELADDQASEDQIAVELARLQSDNARAERTVQQIREKERLEQEIEDLKLKVPWAQYAELKKDFQDEKKKFKDTETALLRMKEKQEDDDGPFKAKKKASDKAVVAEKKAKEAMQKADFKVAPRGGVTKQTVVEDLLTEIDGKQNDIDSLESQSENRKRKIEAATREIEKAEQDIAAAEADAQDTPASKRKEELITASMKDISTQITAIENDMETFRSEEQEARTAERQANLRLNQLGDMRANRLKALEHRFSGISRAYDWIQKNRSRFRGPVLGPVAMEIECPDATHANMLEMQISNVWMSYFVVLHQEDQDLFRQEVPNATNYRPNVAVFLGDVNAPLKHQLGTSSEYARFGIVNTLDEVFQAPLVIKKALDDNFYLSKTFVCSATGDWEGFFRTQAAAQVVYTPTNRINQRKSRYNTSAISTMVGALKPSQFLRSSANNNNSNSANGGSSRGGGMNEAEERRQLELQIQKAQQDAQQAINERVALEPRLREARNQQKAYQAEKAALGRVKNDAVQRMKNAFVKKKTKTDELSRLEDAADPLTKKPAMQREFATLINKIVATSEELVGAYVKWADTALAHSALELSARELLDQVDKMSAAARDRKSKLKDMEDQVQIYRRAVDGLKIQMDKKHAEAKELTGFPLSQELQDKFAALPHESAVLQATISTKTDQAEGVMISDPGALVRYQQRCADIAENERQLQAVRTSREFNAGRIAELKEKWVSELRRITATINQNFSAAFPTVGCAGEVVLNEVEGDDFAKYAIEIRVKFRANEELATLDANRQSGGERSVSTILYLVALQEVAAAPFRVVDEINQGMDPVNERKVWKLLGDAATAPDTPQCFLLTPKLLPDLPFSNKVTVLQIFNGTLIKDVAQGFTQDKILGNRARNLAVTANA
jgi:structural maintenance of chromosomes protein 5